MSWLGGLRAYPDHADPRVAACNMIALVVAWNQPLYPFYVYWFVGGDAWVACWTFLSTPLFIAVPAVARRYSVAGRILLSGAGVANTVLSIKAFGVASGVEWFLLPCAMIVLLAFRWREWSVLLPFAGLTLAFLAALHGHYGSPLGGFSADDYRRFFRLNLWSVATLCVFVGWSLGRALWREARSRQARSTSEVVAR
jgi:hypothetical protein